MLSIQLQFSSLIDEWAEDYQSGLSIRDIAIKYGYHHSTIWRYLHNKGITRTISESVKGENNSQWKGDEASVLAIHDWIKRRHPSPKHCQNCGQERVLDLANISPTYNKDTYTRDIKNWKWLCRSCHMREDGRTERLLQRMNESRSKMTACRKGHEYNNENTQYKGNRRICLVCQRNHYKPVEGA